MLSIDQLARYRRDGFLAIEDFVSPEACAAVKGRANEIVAAQDRVSNRELIDSGAASGASSRPTRSTATAGSCGTRR